MKLYNSVKKVRIRLGQIVNEKLCKHDVKTEKKFTS